jgi:hypothetical protein
VRYILEWREYVTSVWKKYFFCYWIFYPISSCPVQPSDQYYSFCMYVVLMNDDESSFCIAWMWQSIISLCVMITQFLNLFVVDIFVVIVQSYYSLIFWYVCGAAFYITSCPNRALKYIIMKNLTVLVPYIPIFDTQKLFLGAKFYIIYWTCSRKATQTNRSIVVPNSRATFHTGRAEKYTCVI